MRTIVALLLLPALCLGSFAIAQTNAIDSNATPAYVPQQAISVRELSPVRIIGFLGKPLGTRTTISGVLAEGVKVSFPLAVSGIDGHPTKGPFYIEVRGVQLQKGMRFRLEGYESGEFAGPPPWSAPWAQQPFQYRSFFVVTKVIEQR